MGSSYRCKAESPSPIHGVNHTLQKRTHNCHRLIFLANPSGASPAGPARRPTSLATRHLQYQHSDIVVLLIACEHPVN